MSLDDLDLEFEDEEEDFKKKTNDAVQVDVDLEFHTGGGKPRPHLELKTRPDSGSAPSKPAEVKNIVDARAVHTNTSISVRRPVAHASQQGEKTQSPIVGTSALKEKVSPVGEKEEVTQLQEKMKKMEIEAGVKVALAEFKTDYLVEMLSDIKLLEHHVTQLLVRINNKHPDMKNEVLMIKKILADFTAKKRR